MEEYTDFYNVWDSLSGRERYHLRPYLQNHCQRALDARENEEYRFYLDRMLEWRPEDEPMHVSDFERTFKEFQRASKELEEANWEDESALRRLVPLERLLAI